MNEVHRDISQTCGKLLKYYGMDQGFLVIVSGFQGVQTTVNVFAYILCLLFPEISAYFSDAGDSFAN